MNINIFLRENIPIILNEFWSMFMNYGVEGQTILPRSGEVSDVDVVIASSFHLAP